MKSIRTSLDHKILPHIFQELSLHKRKTILPTSFLNELSNNNLDCQYLLGKGILNITTLESGYKSTFAICTNRTNIYKQYPTFGTCVFSVLVYFKTVWFHVTVIITIYYHIT